jgi:molybdopterin-guanine dinucleotide biosynthesis protein A
MPTSGVVLAGGRSRRFGTDKLAVPYRGSPLLQHAVTRVAEACGDVVLVIAPGARAVTLPPGLSVRLAHDELEGEGPLAGLAAGLGHVLTEHALVVAGDMPDLSPAVLSEMLRVAREAPVDAVALQDGPRFQPLPCVVRVKPAFANARTLLRTGERALRPLLESLRLAMIDESTWTALDPSRGTLRDIDEPDDLAR